MNVLSPNQALQATPVSAGLVALSRRPGVPELHRWAMRICVAPLIAYAGLFLSGCSSLAPRTISRVSKIIVVSAHDPEPEGKPELKSIAADGKTTLQLATCWDEPNRLLVEALPGRQFTYVGALNGPEIYLLASDPIQQTATIRVYFCVYR